MKNYQFYVILISLLLLGACRSEDRFEISPVDKIVQEKKLLDEGSFSVMLYDMQIDDSEGIYKHKYRISTNLEDSTSTPTVTEWIDVSEEFAGAHINDLGLELVSKTPDGTVHRSPAPPGYNGYVGNDKYGQWKTDNNGNSFWAFYGQYMFMSSMLNMMAGPPIYRSSYQHYDTYRRSNPGKAYYGTGQNTYGTNGTATKKTNPSFFSRKQSVSNTSAFQRKVASNPSRYSRSRSSSSRSGRSRGSGFRSRGGGFGK